ncbi:MAG TPA: hypothetical protein ENI42_06230, partial [Thermoplasmatales archaeon]|nr:hypothetical protein [Thermoplasmatales archaeon]
MGRKKMKEKRSTIILALVLAAASAIVVPTGFAAESNQGDVDMLSYVYSFEQPSFSPVYICGEEFTRVSIDGCPFYGNANEPRLPVKPLRFLLPQETTVDEIIVETSEPQTFEMGGLAPIELGTAAYRLDQAPPVDPPTPDYDQNSLYPGRLCDVVGVQYFRGFPILHVNLRPVQYLGSTHTITYYSEMKITIKTKPAPLNPLYRGLPEDKEAVLYKVDNAADIAVTSTYKTTEGDTKGSFGWYEYVIITTEDFADYQGAWDFNDLVHYRQSQGLTAGIKTVESIYSEYSGEDNQAKMRNYIKDAYQHGLTWVLLGGDVEYVPFRYLYAFDGEGNIMSDLYYQCLDGNYNYDGDNYYGEKYDGVGGGWIDLYAEVWIGRAPVDCGEQIENFVRKTIGY